MIWASGEINRLLDVIAPMRAMAISVLANMEPVVTDGDLRIYPVVTGLALPGLAAMLMPHALTALFFVVVFSLSTQAQGPITVLRKPDTFTGLFMLWQMTVAVFYLYDAERAMTAGLLVASRNVALGFALLSSVFPPEVMTVVAVAQFPIFLTPFLMRLHALVRVGLAP